MSSENFTNIVELAGHYASFFSTKIRANGDEFVCVEDEAYREEVQPLVREAHGDMFPDDYKYQYIYDALNLIYEQPSDYSYADLHEVGIGIEADIYNHELNKWVSSHLERAGYVDEVLEDHAGVFNFTYFDLLQMAQVREKIEVYNSVLNSLNNIIEGI